MVIGTVQGPTEHVSPKRGDSPLRPLKCEVQIRPFLRLFDSLSLEKQSI
jgi:hypothetical protein